MQGVLADVAPPARRRRQKASTSQGGREGREKALKCASFAFEMREILLEVCYEYKCTLSVLKKQATVLQKYFVQFSVCFVFKGLQDGRWS